MADSWTKLLVLRFSSIGDIIQTTSVLNSLKKYFPNCTIEYLTLKKYAPLLLNHPSIDFLHSIEPEAKIKSIKNLIYKREYELVIDLHNSVRSKLIRSKIKTVKSLHVTKPRRNRLLLFLNHQNNFNSNFNQKEWLHQPLKKLFPTDYKASQISLNVSDKEKNEGINLLNANGLKDKKYFTLIPGAAWSQKQWNLEKYIKISKQCFQKYALIPVIIGSKDDVICKKIHQGLLKNSIDLSGKSTIRQSMSIISNSALTIGSDTGFTYASEALSVPTIAILGPTSKETGAGVSLKNSLNVQKNNIWCRPCSQNGSFPCYRQSQHCMDDLSTDDVFKNVEKLLD